MNRRPLAVVLLVVAAIYFFTNLTFQGNAFTDFRVYWDAGQTLFRHQTVYAVEGHYQFKYAPWVAWFYGATFSQMSFRPAAFLHFGTTALIWAWFVFSVWRRVAPSMRLLALAYFFLTMTAAFSSEFWLGQGNCYAAALLLLSFRFLEKGQMQRAGIFLGLALQFKLYCALALPWLLFRRHGSVILYSVATILATNPLFLVLFHRSGLGWTESIAWIASLFRSSGELVVSNPNVGILGIASRTWGVSTGLAVWGVVVAASVLGFWWIRKWKPQPAFAAILLSVQTLNPIAWPYWFHLATPALMEASGAPLRGRFAELLRFAGVLGIGYLAAHQDDQWSVYGGMVAAALLIAVLWSYRLRAGVLSIRR